MHPMRGCYDSFYSNEEEKKKLDILRDIENVYFDSRQITRAPIISLRNRESVQPVWKIKKSPCYGTQISILSLR